MCGAGHKREAGSEDAGASSLRDTAIQTGNSGAEEELTGAEPEEDLPPSSEESRSADLLHAAWQSKNLPMIPQSVNAVCPLCAETTGSVQTLDVAVQYHPPPPRSTAPPNSRTAGKENLGEPAGDLYEPFARTERGRGGKRRPEWNTQRCVCVGGGVQSVQSSQVVSVSSASPRPSRRFVPASERYPPNLQRDRQRNRLKRQAELLALQERARPLKPELPSPHSQEPHLCSTSQLGRTSTPPCRKVGVFLRCMFSSCSFMKLLWILHVSGGNRVQRAKRLSVPP